MGDINLLLCIFRISLVLHMFINGYSVIARSIKIYGYFSIVPLSMVDTHSGLIPLLGH